MFRILCIFIWILCFAYWFPILAEVEQPFCLSFGEEVVDMSGGGGGVGSRCHLNSNDPTLKGRGKVQTFF